MAAFVAKQLVGNKIKSVQGAVGGGGDEGGDKEDDSEARAEMEQALLEAEEKRKEKYRKLEEERETMRQEIRDKYGIKKKEPAVDPFAAMGDEGRIGAKRRSPAEIAAEEARLEEERENAIMIGNVNLTEMGNKVSDLPNQISAKVGDKCVMQ